jgi:AcrR family transcriptional regulator
MPASHRDRILEGAVRCVQERGVAATTTRDIAAAAGANLGSIPYHFGSTNALLDEALEESLRRFSEHVQLAAASVPPGRPAERLNRTLEALLESFDTSQPLLASTIEVFARALRSERVAEHLKDQRRTLIGQIGMLIRDALPDGEALDDRRAQTLSVLLLALINGLILQSLFDPEQLPTAGEAITAFADIGPLFARGE